MSPCELQHSADFMHDVCTNELGTKFCEFAQLDLNVLWIRESARMYKDRHTQKLNQKLTREGAHSGSPQLPV